jgi:hypothetical protein
MASSYIAYSDTSAAAINKPDRYASFGIGASDDPAPIVDMSIHWEWSNPLNIIPAVVLLMLVISIILMISGS